MTSFKRFKIVSDTPVDKFTYYHCNTKSSWYEYLNSHFDKKLFFETLNYRRTTSNAAFRLSGLEIKVGILLMNEDQSKHPTVSGAVLPSIVMDSVLAIYSILEGLSVLSYFSSIPDCRRQKEIYQSERKGKIPKGIKHELGKNVSAKFKALKALRDRCMHQDCADLLDKPDYGEVFETKKITPHLTLLANYLASMRSENNPLPDSNLFEFQDRA